ncbi:hypothetical protein [Photobacterium sanguinicancri]|uniref:hypothetical protein n=1 Tax=Photobacterium sanguinicancri TaxID=875932 RepID=UPI003D0A0398
MPLLPGRSTWLKQLACHDEVQLKTALIKRDNTQLNADKFKTITTKLLRVYPQNSGYDKVSTMVYLEKMNQKRAQIRIKRQPN